MDEKKPDRSRRDFLKLAGTSAPVAVVALAGSTGEAEAAQAESALGLQKTEHVRKYLETARF